MSRRMPFLVGAWALVVALGATAASAQAAPSQVQKTLEFRGDGEGGVFVDIGIYHGEKPVTFVHLLNVPGETRARVSLPAGVCLRFDFLVTGLGSDASDPPLHRSHISERLNQDTTNVFFFDLETQEGRIDAGAPSCLGDTATESAIGPTGSSDPLRALWLIGTIAFAVAYLRLGRTHPSSVPLAPAQHFPSGVPTGDRVAVRPRSAVASAARAR